MRLAIEIRMTYLYSQAQIGRPAFKKHTQLFTLRWPKRWR